MEDYEVDHEREEAENEGDAQDENNENYDEPIYGNAQESINQSMEEVDGDNQNVEERDDELIDDDYDIPYGDDDYHEVVNEIERQKNEREGLIEPSTSWGRPQKKAKNNSVPSHMLFNDVSDADSDYAPSDELHSLSDSDDEDKIRWPEFDVENDYYDPALQTGMKFQNFGEFKLACKNWSIKHRFDVYFPHNDLERCICECKSNKNKEKGEGVKCRFRLYVAPVNTHDPEDPTVQIKTSLLEHNCSKVFINRHATSEWLAKYYLDQFRADRDWSVNGIMKCIQRYFAYTIIRSKAYKIRDRALKDIHGEEKAQYYKLLNYKLDVEATNPGSTVTLWRELGVFKGYYVCLAPLKMGWKSGCRPIICIDGCWLKGTYGGQLLTAVGIDPNDCIYPIAWGIVMTESTETWMWFLENLGADLDLHYGKGITFMSDRQKGLIRAVHDLFPEAEHRHCVRHIYTNFRERFKGKALKDLLWSCARANYVQRFSKNMEALRKENHAAWEWLTHQDRPTSSWTRAYFSTTPQCDILLNNLCECFNRYILDLRGLPIISMVESLKIRMMRRIKKKKDQMEKYKGKICPKVQKKIDKMVVEAAYYEADFSGGPQVSVSALGGPYIVDMVKNTCTCRRWQLTGLSCMHAICSIKNNNGKVEDYVSSCYFVETFMAIYGNYINPTNSEEMWPEVPSPGWLSPPAEVKRKRGRKKTARRKEAEELEQAGVGRNKKKLREDAVKNGVRVKNATTKVCRKGTVKVKCSICGKEGHNKRHHDNSQICHPNWILS